MVKRGVIIVYYEFKDKIVLVTGGNSGIGKSVAFAFARYGANVIIVGRDSKKGEAVVSEATNNKWKMEFIFADISNHEDVRNMTDKIVKKYGHIDIAFNNAGIDCSVAKVADIDTQNWDKIINTNVNGTFYCMKYELMEMLKAGVGTIVNNVSVSGHKGYPGAQGYVASKHAVAGLTKGAAMEYANMNIRINGISPGMIRTPMTETTDDKKEEYEKWVNKIEPIGRFGEPEEVAETVLWLCSSKASFVTGHILAVDGGILAC